ncbi:MAG: rhomboid family intramembrane serine protease [Chloroflexota bacterium]|nr:MAG: rhomboid family intramembrane serine protease [Chloroflexota bacterium]
MIPYSDPSEPDHIFPLVNVSLIAINFLAFFYELSIGNAQGANALQTFITQFGLVPCEYVHQCAPYPGTPSPFQLTFLTSMFMHAGWLHILGNMLFLWVFGDNIENSMGHARYLVFYLLCGAGANALEIATNVGASAPGLGASGAIAGVLAGYLLLYPRSRIRTLILFGFIPIPVRLPAFLLIGFWFIIQLFDGLVTVSSQATGVTGGVAYWAHVGGFTTGAILIWLFRHPERVHNLRAYHSQVDG